MLKQESTPLKRCRLFWK